MIVSLIFITSYIIAVKYHDIIPYFTGISTKEIITLGMDLNLAVTLIVYT